MFRTKSLNNQQMNNLIERNRPSRIQKQNRNYSLRTLISDKTLQYHRHMEKLIQETNQLIFSNKKSNKKTTPSRVLENATNSYQENTVGQFTQAQNNKVREIAQFQSDLDYVQIQSVPTYLNENTIQQEESQFQMRSCLDTSKLNMSQNKSEFKVTLENQQLKDENKELRRQIQHLQHRLETAQLIRIQKQSESESLKLKIKMLELKISEFEQKREERRLYSTKFVSCKIKNVQILPQTKNQSWAQTEYQFMDSEVQTIETSSQIENNIKQLQESAKERRSLLCRIEQERQKYEQLIEKSQLEHEQALKKSTNKVNTLVNLLGLAQKEIKSLLARLRQAKDHDVGNYKEMITKIYNSHRENKQNERIKETTC